MKDKSELVLSLLMTVVCSALLIWNSFQVKAIEEGTHEVPVVYSRYSPEDTFGEYREATILGLIPFGTEERQTKYGNATLDSSVVATYYFAVLDDGTVGAVKLNGDITKGGTTYDEWVIETDEDYYRALQGEGFTVRGVTYEMPNFSFSPFSGIGDIDDLLVFQNSVNDITLLDSTRYCGDTEVVIPDLPTLGNGKVGTQILLVISALTFAWNAMKFVVFRSEKEAQPHSSDNTNFDNGYK